MIKIEKANKYFNRFRKNEIHAIKNTSLELGDRGLVAILGNSGCGKTTLLNAIGGLDKINKGKIFVNGQKITGRLSSKIDEIRNLNIGYIFQKFHLIEDITVYENVAIVLRMVGIRDKNEIQKRVLYVLEKVGMEQYKNRLPTMLSGGQRQRVAIARAIVKNPNIIIADEPTGNLDSKNSLEIMKIIKSISEEKLVVLVTHEKELAKFFATRVIEVVDGEIVSDYENSHAEDLDYKLDTKVYLKDIKNHKTLDTKEVNIDYYNDSAEDLKIQLVIRNGNVYVKSLNNQKVEVVDENSSIEFVDDYYKKISKAEQDKYKFDFNKIINSDIKLKYKSIYNIFSLVGYGIKKIFKYPFMKKMLLGGFFLSAMFVSYSVYNIKGITRINDENFITQNKQNLTLQLPKLTVADYLAYEKVPGVKYIIPGESMIELKIPIDYFYQTANREYSLSGSLTSSDVLKPEDIAHGKLPENNNEIVLDKMTFKTIMQEQKPAQLGYGKIEDFVGHELKVENLKDLKIVGIVDMKSPSIYAKNAIFTDLLLNAAASESKNSFFGNSVNNKTPEDSQVSNYQYSKEKLTIKEGRAPENDYETVINIANKENIKIGKELETKINGTKLKVVGYYTSRYQLDKFYVSANTMRYKLIEENTSITIYPEDKAKVKEYFASKKQNLKDTYEEDRTKYITNVKEQIISAVVLSGIILAISLIEIYLMMRSSFMSRVKEVGVLRAIGLKKKDVRKMFLGEILAITTFASIPGFALMTYILYNLSKISLFSSKYLVDIQTCLISLVIIVGVNIFVGLLPVYNVLRKTPAEILSRTDVD